MACINGSVSLLALIDGWRTLLTELDMIMREAFLLDLAQESGISGNATGKLFSPHGTCGMMTTNPICLTHYISITMPLTANDTKE